MVCGSSARAHWLIVVCLGDTVLASVAAEGSAEGGDAYL